MEKADTGYEKTCEDIARRSKDIYSIIINNKKKIFRFSKKLLNN